MGNKLKRPLGKQRWKFCIGLRPGKCGRSVDGETKFGGNKK